MTIKSATYGVGVINVFVGPLLLNKYIFFYNVYEIRSAFLYTFVMLFSLLYLPNSLGCNHCFTNIDFASYSSQILYVLLGKMFFHLHRVKLSYKLCELYL